MLTIQPSRSHFQSNGSKQTLDPDECPKNVDFSLSATCRNEINSYWMGSGTTHFSAVIKVSSIYRQRKYMLVSLRNTQAYYIVVPGKDLNLKELQNIGEIAFMLLSISSVVFTSNIW